MRGESEKQVSGVAPEYEVAVRRRGVRYWLFIMLFAGESRE